MGPLILKYTRTTYTRLIIWVLKKRKKGHNDISLHLKIKNTYDIESKNGMNCIYGNIVNKTFEWNLLHDVLNHTRCNKTFNSHYCTIIHGCMNTWKGRSKYKNFRNILDSGCSSTIVMGRLITKLNSKKSLWWNITRKQVVVLPI